MLVLTLTLVNNRTGLTCDHTRESPFASGSACGGKFTEIFPFELALLWISFVPSCRHPNTQGIFRRLGDKTFNYASMKATGIFLSCAQTFRKKEKRKKRGGQGRWGVVGKKPFELKQKKKKTLRFLVRSLCKS